MATSKGAGISLLPKKALHPTSKLQKPKCSFKVPSNICIWPHSTAYSKHKRTSGSFFLQFRKADVGGPMASLAPPAVTYPRSIPTSPSHSRGSFGPVFIVLAIITVLAAIACFLGRACARRHSQPRGGRGRAFTKGDLEDGFEISIPTARPAMNGVIKDGKPSESGVTKAQAKPTENGVKLSA